MKESLVFWEENEAMKSGRLNLIAVVSFVFIAIAVATALVIAKHRADRTAPIEIGDGTNLVFVNNRFEVVTNADAPWKLPNGDTWGEVPTMKRELVMKRHEFSRTSFDAFIGDERALQWLSANIKYFDWGSRNWLCGMSQKFLPTDHVLIVPPNYDFEDVWRWLTNKPFVFVQ